MGSALLNTTADLEDAAKVSGTGYELRMQVAARLAAHRSRRGAARGEATTEPVRPAPVGRSAQIAAAVADRYARTPSYREMLAAEAERAIQQAHAAAEVAALNAQAIAAAQQGLLDAYDEHASREQAARQDVSQAEDLFAIGQSVARLDGFAERSEELQTVVTGEQALWPDLAMLDESSTPTETSRPTKTARRTSVRVAGNCAVEPGAPEFRAAAAVAARPPAGLTVRLYQEQANVLSAWAGCIPAPRTRLSEDRGYRDERSSYSEDRSYGEDRSEAEARALDEEIAFRQSPVFEEPAGPPVGLPANLIEFPRQLVAARKARPRHAEGPLRDELETPPGDGQLRIFEVDPARISTSPADGVNHTAKWSSLWLDAPASAAVVTIEAEVGLDEPLARAVPVLEPASLARRSAAGAINLAIVGAGVVAFTAAFLAIAGNGLAGHAPVTIARQAGLQPQSMAVIGAVSGAFLLLLYHGLFFWFSPATPGMRCVRIALCTFEDGNPTRTGVRRRMAATMLSSCSLGMGYAWAALDEQRLTWHDRMSRMYLRRY